jgi:Tfp pilus assembly protein PilX
MLINALMKNTPTRESGFALLITLIVVGVVLSVGLTILDLSIKQVRLSTNAKESEIAFHATNAGMECARYVRSVKSAAMEIGQTITANCFGETVNNIAPNSNPDPVPNIAGDGTAFLYEYDVTWGDADAQRCSRISTLVASSTIAESGMEITNMESLISGYPDGDTKPCEEGARCTVISVRGYNKSCATIGNYGTVEREVLLQF